MHQVEFTAARQFVGVCDKRYENRIRPIFVLFSLCALFPFCFLFLLMNGNINHSSGHISDYFGRYLTVFHSDFDKKNITKLLFTFCYWAWFTGEALELSEQYTGSGTPDIVTLRHPNTGESAVFLFSAANNSVQEILSFNEGKRGWFIDDTVKNDGKMHLSSPIDPIFLGNSLKSIYTFCFFNY